MAKRRNFSSRARLKGNEQIVAHALGEIRTFIDELKNGTRKYKTIASLGGQIAEAYRGRCVLELLQNAHDAFDDTGTAEQGLITFVLKTTPDPVLLIANSGCPFRRDDFKGLCQLGQSPKDLNKSVGNKGLGFRSVLEVSSTPDIWSSSSEEEDAAYVFRFDPEIGSVVAEAIATLDEQGLDARSPFNGSVPLVDWEENQLERYRSRLSAEHMDGPGEAKQFLSPYDMPLVIEERRPEVDALIRAGHVTVIRLPLDGGRGGSVEDAVTSIQDQLKSLLGLSTTLFLPRVNSLVVDIDGERSTVTRKADKVDTFGRVEKFQAVSISRVGPTRDDDATGRFRVWSRVLGGETDSKWARRISDAVQHLPNKWPEVDRAEVGVAVREGAKSDEGRFVIFLPTEMATGTGGHVNAPFYGSLDRRWVDFGDQYNSLLLDCVADLCLHVIEHLLAGEPNDIQGRALVDILGARGELGSTNKNMLELVFERAKNRGDNIKDCALVFCDDGWATATTARAMPDVADGIAICPADWRRAAAFSVISGALDGRESRVKALVDGLDGSLTPTDAEWSNSVEALARLVQSGEIDATWDDFLTNLLDALPYSLEKRPWVGAVDELASSRFLPAQDGRLIRATDDVRMFFQPRRGVDDAEELVDTIPDSLKARIAFLHGDVLTHEEGSRSRQTPVRQFLNGRFVDEFGRKEIVDKVVLKAVPRLPAVFGSPESDLCSELLDWTIRLLGDEYSDALMDLLFELPLACHGGWYPANKAVFGLGWPDSSGDDLWVLADEMGEATKESLISRALLPPSDPRWGLDVGRHSDLLTNIGVAEGLRLRPVDDVRFSMHGKDLPSEAPDGFDQVIWDEWRAIGIQEARPRHQSWFEYSLKGVYGLPELDSVENLSKCGRQALSRLVLDSMRYWHEGWEEATVEKIGGEPSSWRITSPLKHWLSTLPWLKDGSIAERALSERWHVPTLLLHGHQDRFRHLRPLSLALSRRIEDEHQRILAQTLVRLGLNVYPTDGKRIGPALLNALAAAWRAQPELASRFDVFLGQVRHAWQHFDEDAALPDEFLVWTERRRFEVVDAGGLRDVYLPDHAAKGRSVRESGKGVLEMPVREATRLSTSLVDATGINRASALKERILIDGIMWTGKSDVSRSLDDTRYRWLPVPLLTVAAHGGPNPTGAATKGWADSVDRLRRASLIECESIIVELIGGKELVPVNEPPAWWLPGGVLAVTRQTETAYESLASAAQAMLGRQDLIKDLRLVLGAVAGHQVPSVEDLVVALDRAEIDAQAFADIRSHWAGKAGELANRIRPVAVLLGAEMDKFDSSALDADSLAGWLEEHIPQWEARDLISSARRSSDDRAMGLKTWHTLGEQAQLPSWNAVLERLGDDFVAVTNKEVNEQTSAHVEALLPLLRAIARHLAIKASEPELFHKVEAAARDLNAPADWSTRWWEVPFFEVLGAIYDRCAHAVSHLGVETLPKAESVLDLQGVLVKQGVDIDVDPYETARVNGEAFHKVLLEVYDLYSTWVDARDLESEVRERPTPTQLDPQAFLWDWSEAELWRRALTVLGDEQFSTACGDFDSPNGVRERLGLHEAAVARKRRERKEKEKQAARMPKKMKIAGQTLEIGMIDYARLLREHIISLAEPIGPRVKDDEFTLLGTPGRGGPTGGGGGKKGKISHRRPSPEEARVIGVVGEMHAYRFLRTQFGGRAVQARAWVSETRLKVLPLVAGERDGTSDGHGFDFRFSHDGIGWRVEVKATQGEESSFDLGISEIQAATEIARRASDRLRWRILRVRNALSERPEFDWLPNPFEDGFRSRFRLHQGGMVVSYVRRKKS